MNEEELMLTSLLDCRRVDLMTGSCQLTADQKMVLEDMQGRCAQGEPIQYILGKTDFMGLPICVTPAVLIPRPETELMVEHALFLGRVLVRKTTLAVLDLGTGSGNIAIAMAKFLDPCCVTSVDLSAYALEIAGRNARNHRVAHKIHFYHEDMDIFLQKSAEQKKLFNIVISNPPYVRSSDWEHLPENVRHEPRMALDGGKDGLDFYRMIICHAPGVIAPNGRLVMEIGDGQQEVIEKLFTDDWRYDAVKFFRDYVGMPRFVEGRVANNN